MTVSLRLTVNSSLHCTVSPSSWPRGRRRTPLSWALTLCAPRFSSYAVPSRVAHLGTNMGHILGGMRGVAAHQRAARFPGPLLVTGEGAGHQWRVGPDNRSPVGAGNGNVLRPLDRPYYQQRHSRLQRRGALSQPHHHCVSRRARGVHGLPRRARVAWVLCAVTFSPMS